MGCLATRTAQSRFLGRQEQLAALGDQSAAAPAAASLGVHCPTQFLKSGSSSFLAAGRQPCSLGPRGQQLLRSPPLASGRGPRGQVSLLAPASQSCPERNRERPWPSRHEVAARLLGDD